MLTEVKMKSFYAVKDLAVQAFGNPFLTRSRGEAMRSFTDEVNSKNNESAIAQHPHDYELYEVGTWDDTTGEILGFDTGPILAARALDLKIKE